VRFDLTRSPALAPVPLGDALLAANLSGEGVGVDWDSAVGAGYLVHCISHRPFLSHPSDALTTRQLALTTDHIRT